MTENHIKAAIMFTDLVGYTALTEKDESGALELIRKNRDLHQRQIQKYKGRLVKELGDGFMVTFDNVQNALSCAREIQMEAKSLEFDIPIRIGIHHGEISVGSENIFGLGVNVASGIQAIADPGGIYFSGSIHEIVEEGEGSDSQHMGAVPLKDIKDPVPVYALKDEDLPAPDKKRIDGIIRRHLYLKYYRYAAIGAVLIIAVAVIWFLRTFNIEREIITKSVAVLPLENLSDDPEQEYLSTGMTEELIRELSKVNALTVIAQKSTRQYAGIAKSFSEIAQELNGVNYIVDGTVTLINENIRMEIELIDPVEEEIIWNQTFDQDLSTSRQLWADIARNIAQVIGVFVPEENTALWSGIQPVDQGNYALYLKGMHAIEKTPPDINLGMSYFNEAIEKNPDDAYAWAGLATACVRLGHSPFPTQDVRDKANAAAFRAIQLDSTLAQAWSVYGMVMAYYEWEWEAAEQAYLKANELNPSLPDNHYHYAWYLVLFGRMDEAIREHKLAKALDPFGFIHTAWLGYIYAMLGDYDMALQELELDAVMKDEINRKAMLSEIYLYMGRQKEALEICEDLVSEYSIPEFVFARTYAMAGRIEKGKELLIDLETKFDTIPSGWGALTRAETYAALGDYENAVKWYSFEPHHHWIPWVRVRCKFDSSFFDYPGFKDLMRRYNLPDPAPFQYDPELDI